VKVKMYDKVNCMKGREDPVVRYRAELVLVNSVN